MAPSPADPPPPHSGPHPAVGLIVGCGIIVLGATLVHLLLNVLVQDSRRRRRRRRFRIAFG